MGLPCQQEACARFPSLIKKKIMKSLSLKVNTAYINSKHHKSRGNVMLLGVLLSLATLSFLILHINKSHIYYIALKDRTLTYLCFKSVDSAMTSLIKKIGKSNSLLLSLRAMQLANPASAGAAQMAIESVKRYQYFVSISYKKNLFTNKTCSLIQKGLFTYSSPYLNARHPLDQTLLLKERKWQIKIVNRLFTKSAISFPHFYLSAKYTLTSRFQEAPGKKIKEVVIVDPLRFKVPSGWY